MAQKVRSGSVTLPCLPKVTYSKGSGPHMPVTPDPESQPQGAARLRWARSVLAVWPGDVCRACYRACPCDDPDMMDCSE